MSLQVGQLIAKRYRVESLLGTGAAAEVYKVWDAQRATFLALKLLRSGPAADPEQLSSFREEAFALANLQHPNIVRFYEIVQQDGLIFFLMDFVDGKTLRQEMRQHPSAFSPAQILEILRPVCSALQYAHHRQIVHCDLKPENILIDRSGDVLLSDFGIAALAGSGTNIPGGVGTPAYMAPEQIRNLGIVPQTDFYAIGVILFELFAGTRPFRGHNAPIQAGLGERIRWEQLNLPPPLPCALNPSLPGGVDLVVSKCLAKNPVARFSNAMELLQALESLNFERTAVPVPSQPHKQGLTRVSPKPRGPARNRKWLGVAGVAALLSLFVLLFFLQGRDHFTNLPTQSQPNDLSYAYPSSCMEIVFDLQPKTVLRECVTSIMVQPDGKLQVYFEWKVSSLSSTAGIEVQADTDNHNMYLLDNLGNRLDHVGSGDGSDQTVKLYNGQGKKGWFLFPQADPTATSFYFVDEDNKLRSPRLDRKWP